MMIVRDASGIVDRARAAGYDRSTAILDCAAAIIAQAYAVLDRSTGEA
jgi:hypothetical protein